MYENWRTTDLLDQISLSTINIPWLDVNTKIEYYSHSLDKKDVYLIKNIKGSTTSGTMTISAVKFQPMYS